MWILIFCFGKIVLGGRVMEDNKYREDYLSWDEYFMAISKLSALRSKDPNTQVGACIVSSDNRILSIGYNGAPNGFNDSEFPWKREGGNLDTKYFYVVHAERNAILNYRGSRRDFEGAKLYVDLFPCNECAKEIIQAGIKEIFYLSDKYAELDSTIASKRLFDKCGVSYKQLKFDKKISIDLV
jgi:dCMP deaminase